MALFKWAHCKTTKALALMQNIFGRNVQIQKSTLQSGSSYMQPIVILISGKQGSGKSSMSELLQKFVWNSANACFRVKFAEPLYKMHDAIREILKLDGMDDWQGIDGPLLQVLGTEWGRANRGQDFWCKYAEQKVTAHFSEFVKYQTTAGLSIPKVFYVFDDCRFVNEAESFKNFKTLKIRLECSEQVRKKRAEKWRENTTHPSEIALDEYREFDFFINTEIGDKLQNAKTVYDLILRSL